MKPPPIRIRTFQEGDLALGQSLSQAAGWNQTAADWRRFHAIAGDGCFVSVCDGEPCGTVFAFLLGSAGWVAMMLVDERWRGKGIGRQLMQCALDYLEERGAESIRLDATPLGQPLYESLGFVHEYSLVRFEGRPRGDHGGIERLVTAATEQDWPACCTFDFSSTRTDRRELLLRLFAEQPDSLRTAWSGDDLRGYATSRPGRLATFIGPCVAADDATGTALLSDALERHRDEQVFVDVLCSNTIATEIVASAGLTPARTLTRMRRGPRAGKRSLSFGVPAARKKGNISKAGVARASSPCEPPSLSSFGMQPVTSNSVPRSQRFGAAAMLALLLLMAGGCDKPVAHQQADSPAARRQLKPSPPQQIEPLRSLTVAVAARDFGWVYRFAGDDERLGTADDVSTADELHLPEDCDVELLVTSEDYVCTFDVPRLQLRKTAVPELTFPLKLHTAQKGRFDVSADPMCGLGLIVEARPGVVVIESRGKFESWMRRIQGS